MLIAIGLVIGLEILLTMTWSEPVTNLKAYLDQRDAKDRLEMVEQEFADAGADAADPRAGARRLARTSSGGDPIGRIKIPAIGLEYVVVEGTGTLDLERGVGHYPGTDLPGQGGTVAIAGHRTTYGAPFRRIDELGRGDRIILELPYGSFTYRYEDTEIVRPDQTEVVDDLGSERLVLTACHPVFSAAERIVVSAVPLPDRAADDAASAPLPELSGIGLGPSLAGLLGSLAILSAAAAFHRFESGRQQS